MGCMRMIQKEFLDINKLCDADEMNRFISQKTANATKKQYKSALVFAKKHCWNQIAEVQAPKGKSKSRPCPSRIQIRELLEKLFEDDKPDKALDLYYYYLTGTRFEAGRKDSTRTRKFPLSS